jgi:predicted ArsR family transcriptional regulator
MKRFSQRNMKMHSPAEPQISAAGMRIVKLLVGNPPQTISQMIRATGVTRTAVTEQLNELIAAGFVERRAERLPGRGRPRHLYMATDAALFLLFASNQRLVVPAIWQAVMEVGGSGMRQAVLRRTSELIAAHYMKRVTATRPERRLAQMTRVLQEEGGLIDIEKRKDGRIVVHKRSCPFITMFEESRAVCCVDEEVMSRVVGAGVRRVACRHDGAACCSFELISNGRRNE